MIDFARDTIGSQPILAIFLAIGIGYLVGQINMGGVTIGDAWWHPTERFYANGVLAQSSNVGTLKIAQKLGPSEQPRRCGTRVSR